MATDICPSCKRPPAPAGLTEDPALGAVTTDTLKFCPGTGTKGCIEYTRTIETAPGEPLPNAFGVSDETKAKVGKFLFGAASAAVAVGLFVVGAKALEKPKRGRRR